MKLNENMPLVTSRSGRRSRFVAAIGGLACTLGILTGAVPAAPQVGGPAVIHLSGPEHGPFATAPTVFQLVNPTTHTIRLRFTQAPQWLSIRGAPGTIPVGGSVVALATIDAAVADRLAPAEYVADIAYWEPSTSQPTELVHFILTVQAPPAAGWTRFDPSPDTRRIYVSSATGNNANSGLSPSAAKRTIAAGKALMRNGFPDWLLLKRGDAWDESIGQWIASGRSAMEPMLITSYGSSTARPYLRTGSSDGISALAAGSSPARLDHVAVVGLRFQAHTYTGNGQPSGIAWLIQSSDLLVEDCFFQGYQIDVNVPGWGGRKQDVRVRRNVIVDAIATSGTVGHGIYMANCDDVLIEENILDHNGWSETIPGAIPSLYRHGMYIQGGSGTCTNVTVRGNIISNSASHGLQLRPGGIAEDNLFLRNSIALSLGGGNEPNPGGVRAIAQRNVILDGKNIDAANPRGWGIDLANIASGTVSYNIVANQTLAGFPIPLDLYGNLNGIGVHHTRIDHNVFYNWGGSVKVMGNSSQLTQIRLQRNDFYDTVDTAQLFQHESSSTTDSIISSRNLFYGLGQASSWFRVGEFNHSLDGWKSLVGDATSAVVPSRVYPDPERTIGTYNQSLGGAPVHAAFMAEARQQSKAYWRPQYTAQAVNAYIRAGFGLSPP